MISNYQPPSQRRQDPQRGVEANAPPRLYVGNRPVHHQRRLADRIRTAGWRSSRRDQRRPAAGRQAGQGPHLRMDSSAVGEAVSGAPSPSAFLGNQATLTQVAENLSYILWCHIELCGQVVGGLDTV